MILRAQNINDDDPDVVGPVMQLRSGDVSSEGGRHSPVVTQ